MKKKMSSSFFANYIGTTFEIHLQITVLFHIPSETHIYHMIELIMKFDFSKVKLVIMHAPSCTSLNSFVTFNCVLCQYLSQFNQYLQIILGSSVDRASASETGGAGSIPERGKIFFILQVKYILKKIKIIFLPFGGTFFNIGGATHLSQLFRSLQN